MTYSVRRLLAADAATYRDIRLEALMQAPTAFGGDLSREAALLDENWVDRLTTSMTFGVFDGDALCGVATVVSGIGLKRQHRGDLVGVYLRPAARMTGASRLLLEALIAAVGNQFVQLHLTVTAGNVPARRLYEKLGFRVYGTEPRSLRVEGRYYDEDLMVLRLDEGSGK